MTIAGAWHGAAWTFIIWGAYHGLLLLLYHFAGPVRSQLQSKLSAYKTLRSAYAISSVGLTFLLVAFGWIWFRSPDIFVASQFVGKLCRFAALSREISAHASVGDFEFPMTFIILLLLCLSGPFVVNVTNKVRLSLPFWARAQFATAALVLCYIFAGAESKPFIYFQF
jgi:alginate O-acetyltransferase complex protein AlgI